MDDNEILEQQEENWSDIEFASAGDEERELSAETLGTVDENVPQPPQDEEEPGETEQEELPQTRGPVLTIPVARAGSELGPERPVRMGPALAASRVPEGVMARLRTGMSLREATSSYENERLRAENRALRQAQKNAARVVGSASSSGRRTTDAFDEAWYDGN